ncbi:hypothetical protein [Campylobacter concisus]|uniref:hypothetical protein n=1 Tax=Campylobacter concisus TaxID=199 RepID=UPI001CB82CC8|nr:hypothetical protein [Campylobacter concisus]
MIDILSDDIDYLVLKKDDNDGLSEKIINSGLFRDRKDNLREIKISLVSSYFNNTLKIFATGA